MSTSSYDSVFSLGTTNIVVPVGATVAVLIEGIAGQNSTLLKYVSGGTLAIVGASDGVTLTAAELVSAVGNHYLMGTSEVLSIDGPARFYLMATGATAIVSAIRGRTQGQ